MASAHLPSGSGLGTLERKGRAGSWAAAATAGAWGAVAALCASAML